MAAQTGLGQLIGGTMKKALPIGLFVGAVLFAAPMFAGSASAAPPEREIITLDCDDGESYDIMVNGNGPWTPGRVVGSTMVLVPVAFGEFTGTFTPVEGDPETFTEPAMSKGGRGGVHARDLMECDFTFMGTEPGVGTFTGTGTVTVFATGRRM